MLPFLLVAFHLFTLPAPSPDGTTPRKRATKAPSAPKMARVRPVSTAREAEAIAERETGGEAVSARPVPLNGATGGWEVEVRMPKGDRGYRCIVDSDTRSLHFKSLIPNPSKAGRRR